MAELKIISMDEVPVEEVEWLWYPYIPFGKLTIIHGDGGEGTTTLVGGAVVEGRKAPLRQHRARANQSYLSDRRGRTGRHDQTPTARR